MIVDLYYGAHAIATVGKQEPHKRSYRPDLPMHSIPAYGKTGVHVHQPKYPWPPLPKTEKAKPAEARRCHSAGVSPNKAHVNSYRPDLPLSGYTVAQLVKATKEDKAEWAARPLKHDPSSTGPRFDYSEGRAQDRAF